MTIQEIFSKNAIGCKESGQVYNKMQEKPGYPMRQKGDKRPFIEKQVYKNLTCLFKRDHLERLSVELIHSSNSYLSSFFTFLLDQNRFSMDECNDLKDQVLSAELLSSSSSLPCTCDSFNLS
jgi:hypothetical protein